MARMALDYIFNHTDHNFNGSFVTHFIFAAFFLLFTIPICVQVVTIYDRLHFHRRICALFKNFHRIFQAVSGLYWLAQECHSLQEPTRRLQEPTLRTNKDFVQTSPLPDELLFVLMTRSILVCQPEVSPLTTLLKPQKTLVPQQNRASIESDCQQKNCEILVPSRNNISATVGNIPIKPGTSGGARAIRINHRPSPSQLDPGTSSRTSFRHNTFRKSLVTKQKQTAGYHRHFRNDSI